MGGFDLVNLTAHKEHQMNYYISLNDLKNVPVEEQSNYHWDDIPSIDFETSDPLTEVLNYLNENEEQQ